MNTHFWNFGRNFLRPFYALLHPSKVTGLENIPSEGGFVLCANHIHWRDPIYLAVKLPRRHYHYLGKAELTEKKWTKKLLVEGLGCIPIARGQADIGAIRQCMKVVGEGHGLGIFPQGTRSRDNSPTPMLNGTSMIAIRAGVPIIPVYIDGPYHLFRRADVTVGKPIDISDLGRKFDSETLSAVTKRIETAIWSMRKK